MPTFLQQYQVQVTWTPAGPGARWGTITAEILGGPESAAELHCGDTRWGFGDGHGRTIMRDCPSWEPQYKTPRLFTEWHTYAEAGDYTIRFSYGLLEGSTTIQIP